MELASTSMSLWTSSGLALLACVGLAIIAVIGVMLFFLCKMFRQMEELKENLRVLQTEEMHNINVAMSRMDEEINTMGDRMLFQPYLAEVARLNGLSAANRVEGPEEAFQMFYRLWEGVVRLGGYIDNFEDPVNEDERRELFLRNSTIGERRSRQDSPTSRGDLEDEDFAELSPGETQYGAPQTSPEPEPHGIQSENLPAGYERDNETQLPIDPAEELQGYADRLDQEVQDLNAMRDEAAGAGDEVEAERIGQMIRNLERLLLHLPRPRRLR